MIPLFLDTYFLIDMMIDKKLFQRLTNAFAQRNNQYYKALLKNYEKGKKMKLKERKSFFSMIALKMHQAGVKPSLWFNQITFVTFSLILFFASYSLVSQFLKEMVLSFLLSAPTFLIPFFLLEIYQEFQQQKIENASLDLLLQLKNYVQFNNDIMEALKQVKTVEPLQTNLNSFLLEMNSGVKFEKAIQNLQDKIPDPMLKEFFANIEYCYLYGGSFTVLIQKSYRMITAIHQEKEKRVSETKSTRMVLYFLIILNVMVYITSIQNNYENYLIMKKTILGNVILYWDFISIWLLIFLAEKVKKLDIS